MYVILTESREFPERQVYKSLCYGPFETPGEAREYGREFLSDVPATLLELRRPENISPATVRKSLQRQLFEP